MTFNLPALNKDGNPSTVTVTVSPFLATLGPDGNPLPSDAVLSHVGFSSSDGNAFTVVNDPSDPNGAIITAVGTDASGVLGAVATATESDGTVHGISGTVTITISSTPPPPPKQAASLGFTFGTPQ